MTTGLVFFGVLAMATAVAALAIWLRYRRRLNAELESDRKLINEQNGCHNCRYNHKSEDKDICLGDKPMCSRGGGNLPLWQRRKETDND